MKIIWKSCVDKTKQAVHLTFEKLSHGVKFQEVADAYNAVLDRFCPAKLHRPTQFILTYILFHLYLLYAIIYGITQLIIHHTRMKGSHIIPLLPSVADCREKVIMFVTSIFLWHWFSKSVLGISAGWEYISSWVVHLRPQINIKPQLKLVNASDSCHSNKSNISMNMEEVNADMNVYLSPEKEELADLMKNIQRTSDTASFASDLVTSVAASITRSDSVNSLGGWSSSDVADDEDEVDVDAEFDKVCLQQEHGNDLDMASEENAQEQHALLPETNQQIKTKRKHRLTLKEVAREVLNEVLLEVQLLDYNDLKNQVSSASGSRSRIPRPEALERFRIRNAIANSQLRRRFLQRNPPSDNEDTRFSNSSDC